MSIQVETVLLEYWTKFGVRLLKKYLRTEEFDLVTYQGSNTLAPKLFLDLSDTIIFFNLRIQKSSFC